MALSALTATLKAFVSFSSTLAGADRPSLKGKDDVQTDAVEKTASLTLGTGALQANQLFADTRTLTSGATELLNVSGGATGSAVAIKNPHGLTITATKIVAMAIVNTSLTYGLTIFGQGSADITSMVKANGDGIIIPPGGMYLIGPATGSTDAVGFVVATDEVLSVAGDGAHTGTYQIAMFLVGTAA
jgi:hypothetical protein